MGIAAERKNHVPPRSREAFRPHEQKRLQLKRTVGCALLLFLSSIALHVQANSCLIPTSINNTPTPIIAGKSGLSLPNAGGNQLSVAVPTMTPITGTIGGSLNASTSALQDNTAETLMPFSPMSFPEIVGAAKIVTDEFISPGSYSSLNLSRTTPIYTFSPGNYYIKWIFYYDNAGIIFNLGEGDYYIDNFDSNFGHTKVTLNANGKVRLFIGTQIALGNEFKLNEGGATDNLQIYLLPKASAYFGSTGKFNGLIYGNSTDACNNFAIKTNDCIHFSDGNTITGAIIGGGGIHLNNSNSIIFTPSVQQTIGSIPIPGCVPGLDHYELSLPSTGVACLSSPVKVTACASATTPCTTPDKTANNTSLTLSTTGGTLGATALKFDADGKAATTLSYPAAKDKSTATVTLSGLSRAAPVKCCQDGITCTLSTSCTETFNTSGFVFSGDSSVSSALPAVSSGCQAHPTDAHYYLHAIKNSAKNGTCQGEYTKAQSVSLGYQCINPSSCLGKTMQINGNNINGNANGTTTNTTDLSLVFDANGRAPITFNYYDDVGQVTLFARTKELVGTSNAFVVAPANFAITDLPPAPLIAGDPFTVKVTAQNACNTTTPNFGKESTAATATLSSSNPLPSEGNAKDTPINSIVSGFDNGTTSTNLTWREVGTISLTATATNYLSSGIDVSGTKDGVGGFKPAYFDVTPIIPACGTAYTYSGQPIQSVTVTARERGGKITENYGGDWAKAVTLSDTSNSIQRLINNAIGASAVSRGVATFRPTYTFADKLSAPANIGLRATDTDGVTSSGHTEATTNIRSGRLVLFSALGSNKLDLKMPLQGQYWSGKSWVINSDDNCTTLPSGAFALSGDLAANTKVMSAVTFAGGNTNITLSAPGNGKTGSVNVAVNLGTSGNDLSCLSDHGATGAATPWLRSRNGDCATSYDRDPWARATFGVYTPETRRIVYVHDVF